MSSVWGAVRRLKRREMNDNTVVAIVIFVGCVFGIICALWGLPE